MSATREEISAGVVLYVVQDSRRLYLVLRYAAGHWDLAKGKREPGESDVQAALREVLEETGISDVALREGFARRIEYEFMDGSDAVHKTVTFFLGETKTMDVTLSDEHQDYAWQGYDDAVRAVTYPAAAGVLGAADAWLDGSSSSSSSSSDGDGDGGAA